MHGGDSSSFWIHFEIFFVLVLPCHWKIPNEILRQTTSRFHTDQKTPPTVETADSNKKKKYIS